MMRNSEAAAMVTMVHCHDKSRNLVHHGQKMKTEQLAQSLILTAPMSSQVNGHSDVFASFAEVVPDQNTPADTWL